MTQIITVLQIVFALALISLILIQSRGTGFGRSSSSSFTRRGLEKIVFKLTFVFGALFAIVSLLPLFI